jgi:hypothetical protein
MNGRTVLNDHLIFDCAKRTNGRGIADGRAVDLGALRRVERLALEEFVGAMRAAAAEAGIWQRLHGRLAKALTRACVRLGIAPIALYRCATRRSRHRNVS